MNRLHLGLQYSISCDCESLSFWTFVLSAQHVLHLGLSAILDYVHYSWIKRPSIKCQLWILYTYLWSQVFVMEYMNSVNEIFLNVSYI